MLAPLVTAVDSLNTAEPGTEIPLEEIMDRPVEDCRLLHSSFAGLSQSRSSRTKAFNGLPADACFSTEVVYTFELALGQVYVNMSTWEVRRHLRCGLRETQRNATRTVHAKAKSIRSQTLYR